MILLAGGAGYIGSVLAKELLEKGQTVRIFDKLFFGEYGLKEYRDKVDLVRGDLRNFDPKILDGVTAVVNISGLSNDPTAEYNPQANHEMNTVATENLARVCKEKGIKRYIFASSCSIYDRGFYAEDILQDEDSEVEPRAAYAVSKYKAERILLDMVDKDFCPVMLRKGTVYGFSPRMRYDLVVNTFLKDALMKGVLTVHAGGEMWRPLVDITDVARAYICALEASEDKVRGRIFNIVQKNYRILELAHWVREALKDIKKIDIDVDYTNYKTRSYRVSGDRIARELGFRPEVPVKDSVHHMYKMIQKIGYTDFMNPKYYNIQWMTMLDDMEQMVKEMGSVFGVD